MGMTKKSTTGLADGSSLWREVVPGSVFQAEGKETHPGDVQQEDGPSTADSDRSTEGPARPSDSKRWRVAPPLGALLQ